MNFDDELMMNKWKQYYWLTNQTGKTWTFQTGVLDHNGIILQSSVAAI